MQVIGIDISRDMIGYAQARFPEADFQPGSAEDLPFASGSLVGYRAERIYSHVKNPRPALAEARRVLAADGRFVLVDVENDVWAIDSDDRGMTRAMVRAFADAVANPWIGRGCRGLLLNEGFADVNVEYYPVIITSFFAPLVEQCAKAIVAAGVATQNQADSWIAKQQDRKLSTRMRPAG